MNAKKFSTGIVLLVLCILTVTPTKAATRIDMSFGQNGISVQDFKIGDDEAYDIAVQKDGKILVTGYRSNGAVKDLVVTRFLQDGSLDKDFNSDGVFSCSLGSGDTIGRSIIVQKDGKIVIGGSVSDQSKGIAVLKISAEGYLDTSFAADGYVVLPVESGEILDVGLQLSTTGNIVVSATISPTASADYAFFAKLNNQGQLDNSFSKDGQTTYREKGNDIRINAITVLENDKILGGGSFFDGSSNRAGLLQLNEDGTIDSSYAENGRALISTGGESSTIHSMATASDGSIVIAGAINNGKYNEAFIGKIKEDGTADTGFGVSGIYKTAYAAENVVYDVTLQADNIISAVGFMTSRTGKDIFVLTLKEDTASQTTAAAYTTTDVIQNDDIGYAAIASENNMLLATGSAANGNNLDIALLRFTDGSHSLSPAITESRASVSTSAYTITTVPVTEITRVGAVSGGIITASGSTIVNKTPQTCAKTCESQCSATDNSCYTSCLSNCADEGITVSKRGVVYGTKPQPVYKTEKTRKDNAVKPKPETTATDSDKIVRPESSGGSIFPGSDSADSIFPESASSVVHLGSTDNGNGPGTYTSEIRDIAPGTRYYARAYAVLSTGEVLYGNEYTFTTDDACFIATAAYGSILEKHVVLLRQFRDRYLLTNATGKHLVALYYRFSPPIADIIKENAVLQPAVRVALLPFVFLALFFVKTSFTTKLLCLATGLFCTLFANKSRTIITKNSA